MNFMNEKEEMTLKSYAEMAKTWNDAHPDFDFWKNNFEKFRKLLPQGKIIDIGCGAGRDALLFNKLSPLYSYVGIDISREMLIEAKRLVVGAIFLEMNMYDLSAHFGKDSFDGFWAVGSLLHISKSKVLGIFPPNRIDIVLKKIRKVVKKNGIGFIVIKDGVGEEVVCDKEGKNPRLFAYYEEKEFAHILERNKFKVLRCGKDVRKYSPMTGNNTIYLKYFVRNIKK